MSFPELGPPRKKTDAFAVVMPSQVHTLLAAPSYRVRMLHNDVYSRELFLRGRRWKQAVLGQKFDHKTVEEPGLLDLTGVACSG